MNTILFNRLITVRWSKDWDGWDVGLFSCKIVSNPKYGEAKALRLVIWRLAMWMQITS